MMKVLSNYGDGRYTFGSENLMKNYVELSEDLKGLTKLQTKQRNMTIIGAVPALFCICSSVLIKYVTTNQYFYQLYDVRIDLFMRRIFCKFKFYRMMESLGSISD